MVVPDNLKSAVVKGAFGAGDRHEVELNRTYRELARHYGFKVDPTPTYSPEKKGKVASAVKYITGNWLPTSAAETLDEANEDLAVWCDKTASVRVHRETGRRPVDAFRDKRPAVLPLPTVTYEPIVWKQATVHPDSHVEFDGRLYSVPWRTVGRKVWVRASPSSVYILLEDARIATHERRAEGRRSTCESHLPEHRRDLTYRSVSYWVERAALMGQPVVDYVNEVLESDDVLSKLRDIQAIVEHLETYPLDRAQGACRRASFYSNYSYQGVKRILLSAKDLEPLPAAVVPDLGQLDRPRLARTTAELLASSLETADEPH